MPQPEHILAIEISNPASGPRGELDGTLCGPGVALGRLDEGAGTELPAGIDGSYQNVDAEPLRAGARHDDDLVPAIARLCERQGVGARDLRRVAVSAGPGGFTGIRIALATAKAVAEVAGAEVVCVPSTIVAAWMLEWDLAPALVCLASKRETCWVRLLPSRDAEWWRRAEPAVRERWGKDVAGAMDARVRAGAAWIGASRDMGLAGPEMVERLGVRTVIADQHLPESFREAAGRVGARVVEPIFSPVSVLQIAAGMDGSDPALAAPIYPREPEAVSKWRALHG